MGVTQLWQILSPVQQHKTLAELEGLTLAVDLSIWVCETQGVRQMQGVVSKPFLRNLFFRISHLTQLGVKLVFVIEGTAPELKWEVMMKRQQSRFPGRQAKPVAQRPPGKQTRKNFNSCLKECCELLDILGIPYIQSRGEAEAMCALLNKAGLVDGCLTNDGDAFLYGAETVYRNFTMNAKDPHVEMYRLCDMKTQLSLDREGLVALGLLLGCDFVPRGVPGIGLANGVKLLQTLAGRNVLQRIQEWRSMSEEDCLDQVEVLARRKAIAVPDFPQTKVINEFKVIKDRCPSQLPPWRRPVPTKLQEFVLLKLEWPLEYSLDKVLPLVTLWDMQDILRSVNPSRHQHLKPHRIVKTRVRQGVPCYEVEWHKPVTDPTCDGNYYTTVESQEMFSKCFPDVVDAFVIKSLETKKKTKSKNKKKKKPVDVAANLENLSFRFEKMNLDQLTNKLQKSVHDLHPSFTDYDESSFTPKIRQSKAHPSQAVSSTASASDAAIPSASVRLKAESVSLSADPPPEEQCKLRVKPLDGNFFSDVVRKVVGSPVKREAKSVDLLLDAASDVDSGDDSYLPLMKRMERKMRSKRNDDEILTHSEREGLNKLLSSARNSSVDADIFDKLDLFAHPGIGNTPTAHRQPNPASFTTPKVGAQIDINQQGVGFEGRYSGANVASCQRSGPKGSPSVRVANDGSTTGIRTNMSSAKPQKLSKSAVSNHRRLSDVKVMNSPLLHSAASTPHGHTSSTPIREGLELDCLSTSGFGDFNIQNSLLTSLCSSLIHALTPKGISKGEYENLVTNLQKMNVSHDQNGDGKVRGFDPMSEMMCNIDFEDIAKASEAVKSPFVKTDKMKPIILDKAGKKEEPVKMTRTAKEKLRKQEKLNRLSLANEKAKLNESNRSKHVSTRSTISALDNSQVNQNSSKKSKKRKSNIVIENGTNGNVVNGRKGMSASCRQHSNKQTGSITMNGNLHMNNSTVDKCQSKRKTRNSSQSKINISIKHDDAKDRAEEGLKKECKSTGSSQGIDDYLRPQESCSVETNKKRKKKKKTSVDMSLTDPEKWLLTPHEDSRVGITDEVLDNSTSDLMSCAVSENNGKAKKKKKKKKVKKSVADFDLSKDDSFFDESQRQQCAIFLKNAIQSEKLGSSQNKMVEKASPFIDVSADNALLELDVISSTLTGLEADTSVKARLKRKMQLEYMQKSKVNADPPVQNNVDENIESSALGSVQMRCSDAGDEDAPSKLFEDTSDIEVFGNGHMKVDSCSNNRPKSAVAVENGATCPPGPTSVADRGGLGSSTASFVDGSVNNSLTLDERLNETAVRAIEERAWKLIEERILSQAKKMMSTCGTQTMLEDSCPGADDKAVDNDAESKLLQEGSSGIDQLAKSIEASLDSGALREVAKLLLPDNDIAVNQALNENGGFKMSHSFSRSVDTGTDNIDTVEKLLSTENNCDAGSSSETRFGQSTGQFNNVYDSNGANLGAENIDVNDSKHTNDTIEQAIDSTSNGAQWMKLASDSVRTASESYLDNSLDISCPFNAALKQYSVTCNGTSGTAVDTYRVTDRTDCYGQTSEEDDDVADSDSTGFVVGENQLNESQGELKNNQDALEQYSVTCNGAGVTAFDNHKSTDMTGQSRQINEDIDDVHDSDTTCSDVEENPWKENQSELVDENSAEKYKNADNTIQIAQEQCDNDGSSEADTDNSVDTDDDNIKNKIMSKIPGPHYEIDQGQESEEADQDRIGKVGNIFERIGHYKHVDQEEEAAGLEAVESVRENVELESVETCSDDDTESLTSDSGPEEGGFFHEDAGHDDSQADLIRREELGNGFFLEPDGNKGHDYNGTDMIGQEHIGGGFFPEDTYDNGQDDSGVDITRQGCVEAEADNLMVQNVYAKNGRVSDLNVREDSMMTERDEVETEVGGVVWIDSDDDNEFETVTKVHSDATDMSDVILLEGNTESEVHVTKCSQSEAGDSSKSPEKFNPLRNGCGNDVDNAVEDGAQNKRQNNEHLKLKENHFCIDADAKATVTLNGNAGSGHNVGNNTVTNGTALHDDKDHGINENKIIPCNSWDSKQIELTDTHKSEKPAQVFQHEANGEESQNGHDMGENVDDAGEEAEEEMQKTNGNCPLRVSEVVVEADVPVSNSPVCLADRLKMRLRKSTTRSVLDSFLNGLE